MNDFNETQGDIWVSDGAIVPNSITRRDWNLFFSIHLNQDNLVSNIWINSGSVFDDYNQTNVPPAGRVNNSISTRKMYRAVTRGENLVAWWPFDTDSLNATSVVSQTAGGQTASLGTGFYNAYVSRFGRFGQGVRFRKDKTNARIRIDNNGINLGSAWTLAAWAKNLYPPSNGGRSTLFRGQDLLSGNDYDRYFVIRGEDRMVCLFDGDVGWAPGRYRPTGYTLDPLFFNNWNHFAVIGKGARTRYFVNGLFVGEADRRDQSDVYYIGNSSENEAFAEFIDDVRIYNVSLEDFEVSKVYGGGFGDQLTSVKIETNSTADLDVRTFTSEFGKDGNRFSVTDLNITDWNTSSGSLTDINSSVADKYILSLDINSSFTHSTISIPEGVVFDSEGKGNEAYSYEIISNERVYQNENLLSRWRFDEESDLNGEKIVRDVAVGQNYGFLFGDSQLASGFYGNGLKLDGDGDYFEIPHFRLFKDGNFSLSAWINIDNIGVDNSAQDAAIFSTNGSGLYTMLLWYDVNSVGTANRSFSFNLGPVDINLNRMNAPDSLARQDIWQLITVVVNGSQHSLYLNDEEVVRTDFAGTDQATIEGNSLRIGSWNTSSNQYFSGILDEVRIYDSVLSDNDVSVLYGNGIGDLGVIPRISVDANHSAPIISGRIDFYQFGQQVPVTGFDQNDILIDGGSISSFSSDGNGYIFSFAPDSQPSRITISLQNGSGKFGAINTSAVSKSFSHHAELTGMESLSLWYAFEESGGNLIKDFSKGQIDGNLINGGRIPGKFGQSLSLVPGDYVTTNGESLSLSTSMTVSLWAKILEDAQGSLVRSGQFNLQYHDDQTIRGSVYTGSSWKTVKGRSKPGAWQHYALTYNGNELNFYGNSVLLDTMEVSGYLNWGDGADHLLYIGKYGVNGWDSKVEIDDFRVYLKAFSGDEIVSLYGNGSGDVGIRPLVTGNSPFISSPISHSVSFLEGNQSSYISGLLQSEINATGASLISFSDNSGSDYSYDLNVSASSPSIVRVNIPQGAVTSDSNLSESVSYEFEYRMITSVENDLLAWYPLDQFSGNSTSDYSGRLQHATAVGYSASPVLTAGLFGQAVDLNGQYLELPFRIDQSSLSDGMSFSAWIRPDQVMGGTDNERILFSTDNDGWDWSTSIRFGSLTAWTGANRSQSTHQVLPGNWYHVTSVFDPVLGRTLMYLNGELSVIDSLGFDNNSTLILIGHHPSGRNFDGLVDDIRIWGRPLAFEEVRKLWGNGMGDIGPRLTFDVQSPTFGDTIDVRVHFNQIINDFDANTDLEFSNLNLISSNVSSDSNLSYDLVFQPLVLSESNFTLKLKEGSITGAYGSTNSEITKLIEFRPHRIREDQLIVWWDFNEGIGTTSRCIPFFLLRWKYNCCSLGFFR